MNFMSIRNCILFTIFLGVLGLAASAHAQQVNPAEDIRWPSSCVGSGAHDMPYSPYDNACISVSIGSGGVCTAVIGDATSITCGTSDRAGDTDSSPANVIVMGDGSLANNATTNVVSIGNIAGQNDSGLDLVDIGDHNAIGNASSSGTKVCDTALTVTIGYENLFNCQGEAYSDVVSIGDYNTVQNGIGTGVSTTTYTDVVALGYHNDLGLSGQTTGKFQAAVAIGNSNGSIAKGQNWVSIGDTNGSTNSGSNQDLESDDFVLIGDTNGAIAGGSSNIVAIGETSVEGHPATSNNPSAWIIGIGDSAADMVDNTHDVIGIGDNAIYGSSSGGYTTGANLIGIGDWALVANTSGHDNIAIGDYAGSPGATGVSDGDATTSGSEQILIGDNAGQCSSTPLSDIIVIGDNACANTSNSVTIGTAGTINDTYLFGTIHVPNELIFGSGTAVITFGPGLFSSVPACASGTEGATAAFTDSTTNTWGGTITGTGTAHSGGHVKGYCDGTNWTVEAQ
jgi:hypothetical protein